MTITQDIQNFNKVGQDTNTPARTKTLNHDIISISEYRKLLDDNTSSDEEINKKVTYLEAFCRNIVRQDLEKFLQGKINEQSKKNTI